MRKKNHLFILSNGRVAALDKTNGNIVWEVKLSSYAKGSFSYAIGQLQLDGDKIFVGVSGVLFCLQAKDGALVWTNPLKGWGYHFVSMTGQDESTQAASAQQSASGMASITASTT